MYSGEKVLHHTSNCPEWFIPLNKHKTVPLEVFFLLIVGLLNTLPCNIWTGNKYCCWQVYWFILYLVNPCKKKKPSSANYSLIFVLNFEAFFFYMFRWFFIINNRGHRERGHGYIIVTIYTVCSILTILTGDVHSNCRG